MSAPQIEDGSDLMIPNRVLQLVFAQLGGSVKRAFSHRMEIALVLEGAPICAARAGGQPNGNDTNLDRPNQHRNAPYHEKVVITRRNRRSRTAAEPSAARARPWSPPPLWSGSAHFPRIGRQNLGPWPIRDRNHCRFPWS